MCDKCKELKETFQNAVGICDKQTKFNEYDKQRKKCLKEQGSLQPVKSKPEIKVEKKGRKSKSKKSDDEEQEEPKQKHNSDEDLSSTVCSICKIRYDSDIESASIVKNDKCSKCMKDETKLITKKSTMKPENKKSAKEVEDALNEGNKQKPPYVNLGEKPKPFEGTFEVKNKPSTQEVTAGKPKSQCKYYYRGGLCANSQMDKPFCNHPDDQDKCQFKK